MSAHCEYHAWSRHDSTWATPAFKAEAKSVGRLKMWVRLPNCKTIQSASTMIIASKSVDFFCLQASFQISVWSLDETAKHFDQISTLHQWLVVHFNRKSLAVRRYE
jgi:hypothetical protein